jgi:hypothetical protein
LPRGASDKIQFDIFGAFLADEMALIR